LVRTLKFMATLAIIVVLASCFSVASAVVLEEPKLLWKYDKEFYDVSVSADGDVVAAVSYTDLYVFNGKGDLLWSWGSSEIEIQTVKVSSDGNAIAIVYASNDNYYVAFWRNVKSLRGNPDPTWISIGLTSFYMIRYLGYGIRSDILDMSADGNYVVLIGLNETSNTVDVLYWANALSSSGDNVEPSWVGKLSYIDEDYDLLGEVRITSDGDKVYVSAPSGTYYFYNCRSGSPQGPVKLLSYENILRLFMDITADGRHLVVGVTNKTYVSKVFFFENNVNLWNTTYAVQKGYIRYILDVEISYDGSLVAIAGFKYVSDKFSDKFYGLIGIYFNPARKPHSSNASFDVFVEISDKVPTAIEVSREAIVGILYDDMEDSFSIFVMNSLGQILWERDFGNTEYVYSLSYSTNGLFVAFATSPQRGGIAYTLYYYQVAEKPKLPSKMEEIQHIKELEKEVMPKIETFEKLGMNLKEIYNILAQTNMTYPFEIEGNENLSKALNELYEAYNYLKGKTIVEDIPPIPVGSEVYNRLVAEYGPMLENYPTLSGRIQLLNAILLQKE